MGKQLLERWQSAALQDDLRLVVITGNDVTDGPQSWCLHEGRRVEKQLHQSLANTRLNHRGDALIRAVRCIGKRPTRIGEYLHIIVVDEGCECAESWGYPFERWRWLAPAKVGERPCCITHH